MGDDEPAPEPLAHTSRRAGGGADPTASWSDSRSDPAGGTTPDDRPGGTTPDDLLRATTTDGGPDGTTADDRAPRLTYEFTAPLWVWDARRVDTWTFVSLPDDVADEILEIAGPFSRGFGSLRVEVGVGSTTWRTSIFPDAKARTYVLPIKRAVRDAEGLVPDGPVTVRLRVLV